LRFEVEQASRGLSAIAELLVYIGGPNHISGTVKLELSNFVHRYAISSVSLGMTNYPQEERGEGHVTHTVLIIHA